VSAKARKSGVNVVILHAPSVIKTQYEASRKSAVGPLITHPLPSPGGGGASAARSLDSRVFARGSRLAPPLFSRRPSARGKLSISGQQPFFLSLVAAQLLNGEWGASRTPNGSIKASLMQTTLVRQQIIRARLVAN
jgi:hypothetical protein